VNQDKIDVTVDKGVLTVSATREETKTEGENPVVRERLFGSFSRRVRLSDNLDAEAVEASHHDGVLEIRIPVREEAKRRKITVGTYEIILSQTKKGKNWLPLAADSTMLLGRQTFLNRATETPATAHIEQINGPKHPKPLTAEQLDKGLQEAVQFVTGTARAFAVLSEDFKRKPNNWITTEQEHWIKIGGDPKIFYLHMYWELKEDEALVIEGPVPECAFWNIQLDNWWWESLDYRYLPVHVQKGNAKYNADGSVKIVIAAQNKGVGNYIDTAGHTSGTILLRWVDAKSHPIPKSSVVKLSDL
jgi:hypothetical protein